MRRLLINILFFFTVLQFSAAAGTAGQAIESEEGDFLITEMTGGLDHPWSLAFLPENEGVLITEQRGNLLLLKGEETIRIKGLPEIAVQGQGGLLDVLPDRDFPRNRTLYFSYAEPGEGGAGTAVASAKLVNDRLEQIRVLFRAQPKTNSSYHFGSRLVLGRDGSLYITLGERRVMANAQNLGNHGGSVVRIRTDGSVPEDNPFFGIGGAQPEIYSYGHRNPQGIALHPVTGNIWLHEHGPRGGDEVNILKKGANYGWPEITYGIDYNGSIISPDTEKPGMEQPVIYWAPSIAPSGMAFYTDGPFTRWQGNLFVGALAGKHLRRLVLRGNEVVHQEVLLQNTIGRVRDVRQGPDGHLYILTDEKNGALYRLSPAG